MYCKLIFEYRRIGTSSRGRVLVQFCTIYQITVILWSLIWKIDSENRFDSFILKCRMILWRFNCRRPPFCTHLATAGRKTRDVMMISAKNWARAGAAQRHADAIFQSDDEKFNFWHPQGKHAAAGCAGSCYEGQTPTQNEILSTWEVHMSGTWKNAAKTDSIWPKFCGSTPSLKSGLQSAMADQTKSWFLSQQDTGIHQYFTAVNVQYVLYKVY